MTPIEYAKKCCDTIMDKYREADLPPVHMFHYHAGVFLSGMERTYLLCGEEKYNAYIKKWIEDYKYEFDIIEDEDVEVPDLSNYTTTELDWNEEIERLKNNNESTV